jgi:pimeloyl-ACP methyl ester carboxylesterase
VASVDIDGASIACQEAGQGSPVLLIHGTAANLWGDVPLLLSSQHRVIWYDRRAFGGSKHEPLADLSRHARDAAALLQALDAAPAIVVGWSIGGVVAIEMALEHGDLVSGMVLLEPPLHLKRRPTPGMVRAILSAKVLGRFKSSRDGAKAFVTWALGFTTGGDALAQAPDAWREAILSNSGAILRELDAGTGEHISRARLATLRKPLRWLVGEVSDRAFAAAARRAAKVVPGLAPVPIAGSGHCLQWDRPDAVAKAVADVAAGRGIGV